MVVSRSGPLGQLAMWNVKEDNRPQLDSVIIQHMVPMTVTEIQ